MNRDAAQHVRLRELRHDDLGRVYEFNLDPEANLLAGTIPRSEDAFDAHWRRALTDPHVTARAIVIGDEMVGYIASFKHDGQQCVGYWLGRAHWGQGIASRALELLLQEFSIRPLHAQVAIGNQASLRMLQKSGFVILRTELCPADDRYLACEVVHLILV
jgi:RimJ/RimL family protein N-acetyltransferase